jgi:hypothetical protein
VNKEEYEKDMKVQKEIIDELCRMIETSDIKLKPKVMIIKVLNAYATLRSDLLKIRMKEYK